MAAGSRNIVKPALALTRLCADLLADPAALSLPKVESEATFAGCAASLRACEAVEAAGGTMCLIQFEITLTALDAIHAFFYTGLVTEADIPSRDFVLAADGLASESVGVEIEGGEASLAGVRARTSKAVRDAGLACR